MTGVANLLVFIFIFSFKIFCELFGLFKRKKEEK